MSRVIRMVPFITFCGASAASTTGQVLAVDGGFLGCCGVRRGRTIGVDAQGVWWTL